MKTKLICILLYLCTLPTWGVEIFSHKLNTDNGLPDNNVRSLMQDELGFLWIGTPNGLYRYDGYFFTAYKYAATGNLSLLNNNHIRGIYRLKSGQMLFSEQGDMLSVFDVRLNRFVNMPDEEKQQLYLEARRTTPANGQMPANRSIISDNLGNTVIIDDTGMLWHTDRQTGETVEMRVFDQQMWPLVSSKKYKVVTSERDSLIWVSTNGCGITIYDRRQHTVQHVRQSSGLISTDYIVDMCMTDDGNVWVADEFHGLVCLMTQGEHTKVQMLAPADKGLRGNQVYVMKRLADSTILVANTLGDVYMADRNLHLPPHPTMTGTDIHSLCNDRQGRLWTGSRQQGIKAGNGQTYTHDDHDATTVAGNNIFCMTCDSEGRIWVAVENSHLDLAVPDARQGYTFRHFFSSNFSPRVITQDSKGRLWVGTKKGSLYSFMPNQLMSDTTAYANPLTAKETNYSDISCIYEDSRGQLWVGTIGGGVYYNGNSKGGFVAMTTADGLISNEVQSIVEDAQGVIWIATQKGITCYNPQLRSFSYHYDEFNLMRNYYADNSVCRLSNGQLAFGTNEGIVIYNPQQEAQRPVQKERLTITDLLVNGVAAWEMDEECPLDSAPNMTKEVRLAYDQNNIAVHFSTFSFHASATTRYSYWLEGYDRHWSGLTPYSFAEYKNLPPGRYVLHVKAYDSNQPAHTEKTLTIIIDHPWWLSWWAYLVYLLITASIAYIVYRQLRTIYNLRRRISIEQQLTELKLQFFTNISHEFRTPLTIIRGAMERIGSTKDIPAALRQPVSSMQRSTDRMLRLVNQLLEFRKMQNDKLRLALEETDIVAFVKDIYLNFSDIAENKHISYSFLPNVKSAMVCIDRQHVDKMVYNLLSNAFKYTPSHGCITIHLNISPAQSLTLSVSDTGVGIPKEKQPELFQRFMQSTFSNNSIGIGLHLTKALVDVHHGTIRFEENHPQGSVFTIELPTDRSVYNDEDFLQESQLESPVVSVSQPVYQELMPEPMNDRLVMVVEDDSDVADFLHQTLRPYFEVKVAMDGSDALQQLTDSTKPDLIVSDVMMPVMDGFELTKRLRSNTDTQAIPIILLTALTAEDKRLKGIDQGADAYLTKPFDAKLLIATCRQLIQQREKLRQSYAAGPADRTAPLPEIIVDERDRQLLDAMNRWLYSKLSNPLLSVDDLAEAMGYRRSVFFKKVKALTGQTPADYIRTLRMKRAAELLRDETKTVAEVTYQVGISDPHYFAKVFKQQFGVSPKKYQQGKKASADD